MKPTAPVSQLYAILPALILVILPLFVMLVAAQARGSVFIRSSPNATQKVLFLHSKSPWQLRISVIAATMLPWIISIGAYSSSVCQQTLGIGLAIMKKGR